MPYIPQETRRVVERNGPMVGGELAYGFLALARQYIDMKEHNGLNYNCYADVVAALEVTKFIFQDEDVRKYEAAKRHENGDV